MTDDDEARPKKQRERPRTGDLVILLRTEDPLRAQMITDLLEQEGIPVATPGLVQRSLLGAYGAFADIVVRVPEEDLERAKAIVSALDEGDPADDSDDDDHATYRAKRRERTDEPAASPRLARVAGFAAIVIPGGGHMYVHRYRVAFALMAVQAMVFFAFVHGVPFALLLFPLAFSADVWASSRICFISQGKARPGSEPRWVVPTVAIAVLGALLYLSGPGARSIAGPGDTGMCEFAARCNREHPVNETDCVIAAANDRLAGLHPVYSNACGSCLEGMNCSDAYVCRDACRNEWGVGD